METEVVNIIFKICNLSALFSIMETHMRVGGSGGGLYLGQNHKYPSQTLGRGKFFLGQIFGFKTV